jgi:uncharacterized repeat protein (TIGR02543 family)
MISDSVNDLAVAQIARSAIWDDGTWHPRNHLGTLTHVITLKDGPGDDQTLTLTGNQTGRFYVLPGDWTIDTRSYIDGVLIGVGNLTVNISRGMSGPITITKEAPDDFSTVQITFNPGSGSFSNLGAGVVLTTYVPTGARVHRPENPSRSGFGFVNWFTQAVGIDPDDTFLYNLNTPVTSNLALFAGWSENFYTVTYRWNYSGALAGGIFDTLTNIGHGATLPLPAVISRTGFRFNGWFREASATNAWNFSSDTVTSNINLYAGWSTYINNVAINVTYPVTGVTPDMTPSGIGNFTVTSVVWTNTTTGTPLTGADEFTVGSAYRIDITLEANNGFAFPDTLDATISGQNVIAPDVSPGGNAVTLSHTFTVTDGPILSLLPASFLNFNNLDFWLYTTGC